jgi:hypothetical protein
MRTMGVWLGALVLVAATVGPTHAQMPCPGYPPRAPDACGPGFYCNNGYGMVYGPNYNVRPAFEPWQGFRPPMDSCGCDNRPPVVVFPNHRFARSPRDYFMVMD